MKEFGAWTVVHRDGTTLSQYDTNSPLCHESGEVPFRVIDWPQVESLILESQWAKTTFQLHAIPAEFQRSLRCRRFMTMAGAGLMAFMLVLSRVDMEVNAESVVEAIYWFPDGTLHECPHFECPDVGAYAQNWVHGKERSLMPHTREVRTEVDANVT